MAKNIIELVEFMNEELCASEGYIEKALKYKDEDKVLADMYYNLSMQEYKHHEEAHAQVARLINEYRSKYGEPPEKMKNVYDWERERIIKKSKRNKSATINV